MLRCGGHTLLETEAQRVPFLWKRPLKEQQIDAFKSDVFSNKDKANDLCEVLEEIHDEVESLAEAASVFRSLGGFKKVRRNIKGTKSMKNVKKGRASPATD